jgi:hypothetical protein
VTVTHCSASAAISATICQRHVRCSTCAGVCTELSHEVSDARTLRSCNSAGLVQTIEPHFIAVRPPSLGHRVLDGFEVVIPDHVPVLVAMEKEDPADTALRDGEVPDLRVVGLGAVAPLVIVLISALAARERPTRRVLLAASVVTCGSAVAPIGRYRGGLEWSGPAWSIGALGRRRGHVPAG